MRHRPPSLPSCLLALALALAAGAGARASTAEHPVGAAGGGTSPPAGLAAEGLDPTSRACMTCHDGTLGPDVALVAPGSSPRFAGGRPSANHPVGMSYGATWRDRPASFVPPAALDPRIDLAGGRVTCLSCHRRAAAAAPAGACPVSGALTVDRRRLCLSCHAM